MYKESSSFFEKKHQKTLRQFAWRLMVWEET